MKILKAGTPPQPKPDPLYRGECGNCGCQIETNHKELKVYTPEKDSDAEAYFYVECPTTNCGKWIYMKEWITREEFEWPEDNVGCSFNDDL